MGVYKEAKEFLQDIIAPQLESIKGSVLRLENDMRDATLDIKRLWDNYNNLNERISKMEGRIEGMDEQIITKIENLALRGKAKALENKGEERKKE